ncbi:MAG: hypothetical protein AMXMBFR36_37410 [Acidobacteriota bacterium]
MLTDFQRRAAEAVTAAIRRLGGEIEFRDDGLHSIVWLGEATCSRGAIKVYLYEDNWSADFLVGDAGRVLERWAFASEEEMISKLCEELELAIAQGPFPFFQPRAGD